MTPKPPEIGKRSTSSTEIASKWNNYLIRKDERAHGELLRTIDRFVRAEASRMLADQTQLAEEAAQESLLGAQRKIATLEIPDHPAAYVRKILSNNVATVVRRETRLRTREERYATPEVVDVDLTSGTDWHDLLDTLRRAVNDDEFWTLVLRHHFDFSYEEIGELLEKQPGTIRQIAFRGRRKACDRMNRLEGRMPAWLSLDDLDDETDRRPEALDSVDDPRRVSAESTMAVPGPPDPLNVGRPDISRRGPAGRAASAGCGLPEWRRSVP